MTIEAVAARAETSKVTVYKWWRHKAAILLEAFLLEVEERAQADENSVARPVTLGSAKDRRLSRSGQPWLWALRERHASFVELLSGETGELLAGIAAEALLDPEVREIYREHWMKPRRDAHLQLLKNAVGAGEMPLDLDANFVLDLLFGPIYLRLLVSREELNRAYAYRVFASVIAPSLPQKQRHGVAGQPRSLRKQGHSAAPSCERGV